MGAEDVDHPSYSLSWRLLTFLAVDLALSTGFMTGHIIVSSSPIDTMSMLRFGLAIFGIQAIGIIIWLGIDAIRHHISLPLINLRRPWWRLRARLRKRLIRDRSKHDYRSAEGSLVVPAVLVGTLFSLSLATSKVILILLVAVATVVVVAVLAWQYRGAAERPVSTIIWAALSGFMFGYFVT